MGLYGFKKQFIGPILSGRKKQTIRGRRKHPDDPGDRMYLYQALRTKATKKIEQVECVLRQEITIRETLVAHDQYDLVALLAVKVEIDGVELSISEKEALAKSDGFRDFMDMARFWIPRMRKKRPLRSLPFDGFIFHWKSIPTEENKEWLKKRRTTYDRSEVRRSRKVSRRRRGRDR